MLIPAIAAAHAAAAAIQSVMFELSPVEGTTLLPLPELPPLELPPLELPPELPPGLTGLTGSTGVTGPEGTTGVSPSASMVKSADALPSSNTAVIV